MANINPLLQSELFGVQLNDRFLWKDGDSSLPADDITSLLQKGLSMDKLYVTEITNDVIQYNTLASSPLSVKNALSPPDLDWNIPKEYSELDIADYITEKLNTECKGKSDAIWIARMVRVADEMKLYVKFKLIPVLRTIIYVINTLEENNQVWGVGRGSSVSSYILYLIGVHDVDSIEYGLEITDFLR